MSPARFGGRTDCALQCCGRHPGQRRAFEKIHHAQALLENRAERAVGKHVVRPADIIANRLRRPRAQENRARMGDLFRQCVSIGDANFQMFRRDAVRQLWRPCPDRGRRSPRRNPANWRRQSYDAPEFARCRSIAALTFCAKTLIIGDQDRLRAFVMFSLAQHIERDPVRVVIRVRDHQNFRRARRSCRCPTLPKTRPLGGGNKSIARPGDLVDRRDGFSAIGQCCNRLRATDTIDLIHTRQPRRQQHQRIGLPVRRGHGDRQPSLHPPPWQGSRSSDTEDGYDARPAWHIKPRRTNRRPAPAEHGARRICPAFIALASAVHDRS